ncbi:hypothetical protein [Streptomyces sp. NPDC002386]
MRIREQTGHAPERPHYALLLRTDHPQRLESHLHGFDTNPDEVLALAVETIRVTAPEAGEAAWVRTLA